MPPIDVADDLRRRIIAGEFEPDGLLPTVPQLTDEYGVGRGTIDRALRELRSQGLITTRQGKRSLVRRRRRVLRNLDEELRLEFQRALDGNMSEGVFEAMTGADDVQVATTYASVKADEAVAEHLDVEVGAPVLERTFRHTVGGEPFQIARSYLPAATAVRANLFDPSLEVPGTGTLLQLHRAGITIEDARFTIEARMPSVDEAFQMAMEPGTPVVEVWRVLNAGGRPVETLRSVINSDKVGHYLDVDLKGIKP